MIMNIPEIITAILGSSGLTALGTYFATRQKQSLSGDEQVRATFQQLLQDERKENHFNDSKVIELTARIEVLITENTSLRTQITHLQEQLDIIQTMFVDHCQNCKVPVNMVTQTAKHKVAKL
jgi:hypothetical protein